MDYKKKVKYCQKMGALRFQKFVFKIEDIKWRTLKRLCPNFIKYYDKYCDHKIKKKLRNIHSNTVKEQIKNEGYLNKLIVRREFNKSQNRNYHIDKNNPNKFMEYLEWNKKVHVIGLKTNLINLPLIVIASTVFAPSIILLGLDFFSMFVNFQCINIQNYNINRLKDYQQRLQESTLENHGNITREQSYQIRQRRKMVKFQQNYGEAANLIYNSIKKKDGIPSFDEILDNVENQEQLAELRNLVVQALDKRNKDCKSIEQEDNSKKEKCHYKGDNKMVRAGNCY